MRGPRIAAVAACGWVLAACAATLDTKDGTVATLDSMAGRWILSAPNAPPCGINFSGGAGAHEGGVSPEGGCPAGLYRSRRWMLEQAALTIADEDGELLAQLNFASGKFDGRSTAGTPITLTR